MLRAAPQKMSAAWCWWLPALLWGVAGGYVVLSSVSWPLPEAGGAADELHSSSTEEALPGLLEEAAHERRPAWRGAELGHGALEARLAQEERQARAVARPSWRRPKSGHWEGAPCPPATRR